MLVTAFGDIYVESAAGEILVVDTIALGCEQAAHSVAELESLFRCPQWSEERLLTELALLARDRGISREPYQVFALAPHPCLSGEIRVEQIMPMDLVAWHHICRQHRSS
ncbi:MAG: hypothetical protein OES32_09795 [Acidobacteriota bacterium]|nr:hypothetical protein [Acidobacteriota bacterium]